VLEGAGTKTIRTPVLSVSMDEPAFNLSEVYLLTPDSAAWNRYQVILVIRGDKLAEFQRDLGPRDKFSVGEFRIPGGLTHTNGKIEIVHTVGELVDIADTLRMDSDSWQTDILPSYDFFATYYNTLEEGKHREVRRTTTGPVATIQR
jgi:hypothetical protein